MVRRDLATHTHIKDAAVVRVIVHCWSHTDDGHIGNAAAEQDQRQQWRAPSMRWRSGAWRFGDVIARTHDASEFDTDDDEDEADRAVGSTASITQSDRYDADWDDTNSSHRPGDGGCGAHAHCASNDKHISVVVHAVAAERDVTAGARG